MRTLVDEHIEDSEVVVRHREETRVQKAMPKYNHLAGVGLSQRQGLATIGPTVAGNLPARMLDASGALSGG
jgi:hypothetical protein